MIWGYNLNLKIIADLTKIKVGKNALKDNVRIIGSGIIQQGVSSIANKVSKFI